MITAGYAQGSRRAQNQANSNPGTGNRKPAVLFEKLYIHPDSLDKLYPDSRKTEYSIAYLLPLDLDNTSTDEEDHVSNYTKAILDFYLGSTIAFAHTGKELQGKLKFVIHIYDTKGDPAYLVKNILPELDKDKPDLIIGTFMAAETRAVSEFSRKKRIPFISPVINSTECLKKNPYFVTEKPSLKTNLEYLVNYAKEQYPDYEILMFGSGRKELDSCQAVMRYLVDSGYVKKIHTVELNEYNWNNKAYMSYTGEKYIFYIPLSNEFVVNSVISGLMSSGRAGELVLFVPYKWLEYSSVDISYLMTFKTIFFAEHFVDYKDSLNYPFIRIYREKYNTEPSKYAFLGYRITERYMNALSDDGKYFIRKMYSDKTDSTLFGKDYSNEGIFRGFERTKLTLLKFTDYELTVDKKE